MTRPWGEWQGSPTFTREGESTRPGQQVETALERREREAVKGTSSAPTSSEGSRGPGDGEPGLPPRVPAPRPSQEPAPETHPEPKMLPSLRDLRGAEQMKALAQRLTAHLKDGPRLAAPIRQECRRGKISAAALTQARIIAGVVSYFEPDGAEAWGTLAHGLCPHCADPLRCAKCGRSNVLPVEVMYPLSLVARYCLAMKPDSLRSYLNRHKGMFPPRYRRKRGGGRERVLTAREAQMLQEYAIHSIIYSKRRKEER